MKKKKKKEKVYKYKKGKTYLVDNMEDVNAFFIDGIDISPVDGSGEEWIFLRDVTIYVCKVAYE